jgi:hypothetical protein
MIKRAVDKKFAKYNNKISKQGNQKRKATGKISDRKKHKKNKGSFGNIQSVF